MNRLTLDRLEEFRASRKDESIIEYLVKRSLGSIDPTRSRQAARSQYVSLHPSATLYEQEMPSYLKRFSLSGRYLVGFGRSNHSVLLYNVMYQGASSTYYTPLSHSDFFQPYHEIVLCAGTETICRDFCLFTPDDKFMIVASAESSNTIPNFQESNLPIRRYPHSLSTLSSLDEIKFHLIDIENGRVVDRLKFSQDYILLSNHAGVSMNGRNLAIVSLQNQLIQIYHIEQSGRFILTQVVGHVLYTDEELAPASRPHSGGEEDVENQFKALLGLKQRLFAFLYKRAITQSDPIYSVRLIYTNWSILESLCISRVQFLDCHHLLIKLGCPEALGSRSRSSSDGGFQSTAFYIIYCLDDTQIKSFHRSTSPELYKIVHDYNDFIRIVSQIDHISGEGIGLSWQTCPANDVHERQVWERNVQLLSASKPTQGELYAAKRLLLSVPYPAQSYSESPFSDPSIFRFDERSVSSSDRQRSASEYPVRFFSRRSDRLCFKLNSGGPPDPSSQSNPYRVK